MKKQFLQMLFAMCFFLVLSVNKVYAGDYNLVDNQLIENYYDFVDEENWEELYTILGNEYATAMESYITNSYYQENKLGVYALDKIIEIENLGQIDTALYSPIINECEGKDISIYLVKSDIETTESNEFYFEGINYNLVFVGSIDSERKIVAFRMPFANTIEEYENKDAAMEYSVMRFDMDGAPMAKASSCTYNQLPTTIKVARWKHGDGNIEAVNLQKYVKVVACAELGYVDRDEDYHYAGILAIRNYGWYHIITADSNANYHVTDTNSVGSGYTKAYQQYIPDTYWNNATWNTMYSRVEAIWNKNFFSTDYSHIESWYSSASGVGEENSGRMNLGEANSLANKGKDYQYISNCFYGNSYQSTGDLKFVTVGNHVYYKAISGDDTITTICRCGYKDVINLVK